MQDRQNEEFCPSPPLPDGEVSPGAALGTRFENLRWFIETKNRTPIPPRCPLGKAFALLDDRFIPPPVSKTEKQHLIRLVQKHRIGDWAVNALFARHTDPTRHVDAVVHGHFIDAELLAADTNESRFTMLQPLGIGTLFMAGCLVQGGRGGRITISGNQVEGYDISYEHRLGPMLIERKDRAYEAGLNDTPQKQLEIVLEQIELKGPKIPRQDTARILSVGFWSSKFLSKEEFESRFFEPIRAEFLANPNDSKWPDCVTIEFMAGFNDYIRGRLILAGNRRPEFIRIYPVLAAAMPEQELVTAIGLGPDGLPRLIKRVIRPFRD